MSGETRPVRVPGFDQRLTNPLNKPATPFAAVNAGPAGDRQESFDRRFGSSAAESANPNLPAWMRDVGQIPRDVDRKPVRYLGRRVAGQPEASTFDVGAPAVPFVPPNEVLSSDRPSSIDNRFGNWTASPAGITPRNPNLHLPAAEPGRPPGIFNDPPMPLWTAPPPIWGASNAPEVPGAGQGSAVGFGNRRKSQAPTVDTRGAAAPLAPSEDSIPMGGLAGRIAALAGIDPDNPDRPVPPPGGLLALLLAAQQR